jgi:hypothetical protein
MEQWFEQARQFAEMWTEFASKASSALAAYERGASPSDAVRQVRGAMFRAMSQFTEEFMRRPEFLIAVRQLVDAASTVQKQMNDCMTEMRHQTQGVARDDIDSVLQSVEHLETRLLDRLEELSERLGDLERRVPTTEPSGRVHGGEGQESETAERSMHAPSWRQSRRSRDEKES